MRRRARAPRLASAGTSLQRARPTLRGRYAREAVHSPLRSRSDDADELSWCSPQYVEPAHIDTSAASLPPQSRRTAVAAPADLAAAAPAERARSVPAAPAMPVTMTMSAPDHDQIRAR